MQAAAAAGKEVADGRGGAGEDGELRRRAPRPHCRCRCAGTVGGSGGGHDDDCDVARATLVPTTPTPDADVMSPTELLSSCVDAVGRGCAVIRSVHARRAAAAAAAAASRSTDEDDDGSSFAVTYKDVDDPRSAVTEADVAAQDVIVTSLRRLIVGEEDDDEDGDHDDGDDGDEKVAGGVTGGDGKDSTIPLSRHLLDPSSSFSPGGDDISGDLTAIPDSVPFDAVTIFVDPVDGTREFVEGRLGNVQCLVGIAIGGRAVAGAVGLPFPTPPPASSSDNGGGSGDGATSFPPPVVVYGLVGRGVGYWTEGGGQVVGEGGRRGVAVPGHLPAPMDGADRASGAENEIVISTGDSSSSFLASERRCAEEAVITVGSNDLTIRHVLAGGSGNKLLMVARGLVDVALVHDKTCLWDSCAPEAVLVASGGTVTDAFGSPLVHSAGGGVGGPRDPSPVADGHRNALGVIASRGGGHRGGEKEEGEGAVGRVHGETCRLLRGDAVALGLLGPWGLRKSPTGDGTPPPPQAVDVARSLDGAPLDVRWIEEKVLGGDCSWRLESYDAPEDEAVRGLMSNGCRLRLHWTRRIAEEEGDAPLPRDDVSSPPHPPRSAFYKRIVMGDLPHARLKLRTMPKKLERDVRSYGVESAFYSSGACRRLIADAGVHVPRAHDADLRPSSSAAHPIEGKFALLLEDFNASEGWRQEWLLGERSARAALESFANMHAYFWEGSDFWTKGSPADAEELREAVWPSGGYVQPSLQTDGQSGQVASGWDLHLPRFAEHEVFSSAPELEGVDLDGLGRRLEAVAAEMGKEAHPFCDKSGRAERFRKWRTLTHGDPKQANIFVRDATRDDGDPSSSSPGRGDGDGLDVGLIDFQWCGFGLAATDVAHNITAALLPECLSVDGTRENDLLDHYYSRLCRALVEFGAAESVREVEEELFPRNVLQGQYETAVLDMCRIVFAYSWRRFRHEEVRTAESANRNSYNKSVPTVVWLVARCDALLRGRGVS